MYLSNTARGIGLASLLLGSGLIGCDRTPPADRPSATEAAESDKVLSDRSIRILLLDELADCRLAVEQPFDLIDFDTQKPLARNVTPGPLLVRFDGPHIQFSLPEKVCEARAVDLVPRNGGPTGIDMGNQSRRFRGSLRFLRRSEETGAIVNILDIEDYLVGVVSAELPRKFHSEAFRSQAIAARTYAWYHRQANGQTRDWDVRATEAFQVYGPLARQELVPQARRAVRDTRGLVCTWPSPEGERIFCAYYSSTCGGSTQAAGPVKNEPIIKPLTGNVRCDFCRHAPAYRWDPVRLEKSLIAQQLADRYPSFRKIGPIENLEVIETTPAGRPVRFLLLDAEKNEIKLEAENFRLAVDPTGRMLKSTFFVPVIEDNAIVFAEGKGFGHGIGLCQYGADGLARTGRDAATILRFYYPGSHLTRAY